MTKEHLILIPSALNSQYVVSFVHEQSPIGPEIRLNVRSSCQTVSLIWLNQRGGYDSYAFQPRREEELSQSQERARFQAADYSYSQSVVSSVESGIEGVLTSEFLPDEALRWLSSIAESPEVYLADNDSGAIKYFPVTLQTTTLPHRSRELQQLVVGYRYAQKRMNQNSLFVQPPTPQPAGPVEWQNVWN